MVGILWVNDDHPMLLKLLKERAKRRFRERCQAEEKRKEEKDERKMQYHRF